MVAVIVVWGGLRRESRGVGEVKKRVRLVSIGTYSLGGEATGWAGL